MMRAAVLLFVIGASCVRAASVAHGAAEKLPVAINFSPNHESEMWSHQSEAGIGCPSSVQASLQVNKQALNLSLQLNEVGQQVVPVMLDDGTTVTRQILAREACFYKDDTTQADVLLRPTEHGLRASGRLHTADGVYALESNRQLQHSVYKLTAAKEVKSLNENNGKQKRGAKKYIEVVMVFSQDFYKFQLETEGGKASALQHLKYNCVQMVQEMNYVYSISKSDIVVALKSCYILETSAEQECMAAGSMNVISPSGRKGHNAQKSLPACAKWVQANQNKLPKGDHYMFLTKYDLYAPDAQFGLLGLAYLQGVCTTNAVSVVEDDGLHRASMVGAHELGHNLGARHDGSNTQNPSCPESDQYVMSPISNPNGDNFAANAMHFSRCSIENMATTLASKDCVGNQPDLGKFDKFKNPVIGKVMSLDEQCVQAAFGKQSRYCGGSVGIPNVCVSLQCTHPTTGKCMLYKMADQGTPCGNGKRCQDNECVTDPAGAPSYGKCEYGDAEIEFKFNGVKTDCKGVVKTPGRCYNDFVAKYCCGSCRDKFKGQPESCKFGDKASFCSTLTKRQCYANEAKCCATCGKWSSGNAACKYGDKATWCNSGVCGNANNDAACCETCK